MISKFRITLASVLFAVFAVLAFFQGAKSLQVQADSAYQVSGFVRFQNQAPVTGAKVVAHKAGTQTRYVTYADANGLFIFSLTNGTYTVKPIKLGLSFIPHYRLVSVSGSDVKDVNFSAN